MSGPYSADPVLVIRIWDFEFVWDLCLGIWDFACPTYGGQASPGPAALAASV